MDKVGDLLIRIKNGYMASRKEVVVTYSKLAMEICRLLKEEGYIADYKPNERLIDVTLKYENRKPVMTEVKRVSKPGRRVYIKSRLVPRVLNGMGVAIVSTPQGLMNDKDARKKGLGGEIMAYIW